MRGLAGEPGLERAQHHVHTLQRRGRVRRGTGAEQPCAAGDRRRLRQAVHG